MVDAWVVSNGLGSQDLLLTVLVVRNGQPAPPIHKPMRGSKRVVNTFQSRPCNLKACWDLANESVALESDVVCEQSDGDESTSVGGSECAPQLDTPANRTGGSAVGDEAPFRRACPLSGT